MTPSFILELKLQTSKRDDSILDKRFFLASKVKNVLISHANHCLNILQTNPRYHELRQKYHKLNVAIQNAEAREEAGTFPLKDKKALKKNLSELSSVKKELNQLILSVGLSSSSFEGYLKVQQKKYETYLDAQCVQKIAKDVFSGVQKILYSNGKRLHFKSVMDTYSITGKSNKQGIRFSHNRIEWLGLSIGVYIKKGDDYAREALTHRVKYCRLIRKMIGSRWHYYVQLVLEGIPPIKHRPGEGTVGIDNGTSVFAVSTDKGDVSFELLGVDTEDLDAKIVDTQQAIDRSVRATNPNNFNKDGTVKKGRKCWLYSRRCKILRRRLKNLYRRKAARLKQKNEILANRLLAYGSRFITEPVRWKAIQKRAKETKINPKTGRPYSKKRGGRTLARHSPGAVIDILNRKANYFGLCVEKVNLATYRASQYDHINDTYTHKTLDKRWVKVGNEWVQRDLYSSFLLRCANQTLDQIDRAKCAELYAAFKTAHDNYINALRESGVQLPSCCGIHSKKAA